MQLALRGIRLGVPEALQRCHLAWTMRLFYKLFHRPIRRNLLGPRPCLTLFKLYKLGYYLTT